MRLCSPSRLPLRSALRMASEFQLDPLLLLRATSPCEDEILPAITALYLSSSSSSDGSEPDEEERKWREALRAALEEDLERQVRMKLGLDLEHTQHTPLHHTHTLPTLSWHLRRLQMQPPPSLAPHMLGFNRLQGGDVQMRGRQRKKQHAGRSDVPLGGGQGGGAGRGKEGERGGGRWGQVPLEQADIFQYLHSKYGTPAEQLRNLAIGGNFKTRQSQCSMGDGGVPIRWPVEANIVVPTPRHIRQLGAQLEPMNQQAADVPPQPHPSPLSNMASKDVPPQPHPSPLSNMASNDMPPNPHPSPLSNVAGPPSDGASRKGRTVYNSASCDPAEPCQGVLSFESRFESGNLQLATQVGAHEYNLLLRTDLYTTRHTQWYYFRVGNMESDVTYTFHIINLMKTDSLYNYGMQPLLYSECDAEGRGVGWRRVGHDIRYYRSTSGSRNPLLPVVGDYYTLTWKMEFPHNVDTCYLAHCYPYPYSTLLHYLNSVELCPLRGRYIRKEELCQTLAGNPCYVLTITDFDAPPDVLLCRKGVVISSRVHPGETNSSWMMEGVVQCLTADTTHARSLRSHYVFKLVPMMNPDGVIAGNYRTSLAGVDLNRVYKKPVEVLFPTVFHTKKMIADFMQERELLVYVDLHGHSRKHNVFMYGCHMPQCDHTQFLNERVLPFLLSQESPDMFCFRSCKYNVHRSKEATGRVVVWRMGVANSFTMEATFCGSTLTPMSHQFTEDNLVAMGTGLCEAIHKYHRFIKSKSYQQKILSMLAEHIMKSIQQQQGPPTQPAGPPVTSAPAPLPDIVTSSLTPRTSHAAAEGKPAKSSHRKHSSRVLRKFSKYDMSLLEQESSTSGSDSENDEFDYHKRKHLRHKKRRRCRSLQTHTQPHLPLLHHAKPGRTLAAGTHPPTSPPTTSHLPLEEKLASLKLHNSAPARLQSLQRKKMLPSGWKFVNRYANRSNKGIPMFAEERLKERAERQKLQSMSTIEPVRDHQATPEQFYSNPLHSITQLPRPQRPHPLHSNTQLPHPHRPHPLHSITPQGPHPLSQHPHQSSASSIKAIPFLWRPVESHKEEEHPGHQQLNPLRPPPPSSSSSLHHYERIKGLVEGGQPPRRHLPRQLGASLLTPHDVTSPQFQRLWREGRGEGSHLSPRLAKYISEVWSASLNQPR